MATQVFSYIFFFSFHFHMIFTHFLDSTHKISPPSEFLNHPKGVIELKKYLWYLGYMDYDSYSGNHIPKNKNTFDDSLALALKKYQKFYNLNITGKPDSDTITKMLEPRCGLPDFYKPNKSAAPFHVTSHYSLFPGQPKWPKRRLKYGFNKYTTQEAILTLEHALKLWASSTPFRFYRVKNVTKADIQISFTYGHHGDGAPFIGPAAGLAHTFAPPDGRVHFDAAQNWSSNAEKGTYDVLTVGLHEFGHALGLGHSPIKEAIMYPTVNLGERKGIHEDDIQGIKALYKLKSFNS